MSNTLYYGTCVGGPYNKRQMAHAIKGFSVAIDKFSKKTVPAMQRTPVTETQYDFGEYRFSTDEGTWIWHDSSANSPTPITGSTPPS